MRTRNPLRLRVAATIVGAAFAGIVLAPPVSGDAVFEIIKTFKRNIQGDEGNYDINDNGQIIGNAFATRSDYNKSRAFVMTRRGSKWQRTYLRSLGGKYVRAWGNNNLGQVVGTAETVKNNYERSHAFLWQEGRSQDLGTLGGFFSLANDINESQQVAGFATRADGWSEACVWQNGGVSALGTLGGIYSWATSINESGKVVGAATTPEIIGDVRTYHACLWQNGTPQDLGTLGGRKSVAQCINDSGQVVGSSETTQTGPDGTPIERGFFWENGSMYLLPDLGGTFCTPHEINNAGIIIGRALTSAGDLHAVMWQNEAIVDLNTLLPAGSTFVLTSAIGINNVGQIVCRAEDRLKVSFYLVTVQ